jgi:hypothetical protein
VMLMAKTSGVNNARPHVTTMSDTLRKKRPIEQHCGHHRRPVVPAVSVKRES